MTRILAACRTPVVPQNGAFAQLEIADLAVRALHACHTQVAIDISQVDELIVSNAIGGGGNPARLIALAAGLPGTVAGLSIDRQCAGGLDAILMGHALISSGQAEVVLAGGVESHSRRPIRLRTFPDGRPPEAYDSPPFVPWPERDVDMTKAAALMAQELGISREKQDAWAIDSHAKARATVFSDQEIVPLEGLKRDPFARDLNNRLCARAKVMEGSITVANMAVAADAAAFCLLVSDRIAAGRGLRVLGGATVGAEPTRPGLAPIVAVECALQLTGMTPQDIDITEVMEAYAAQAIACIEKAGFDSARVNLGGGALARGHPIGASGTVNAVRLFHEMKNRSAQTGLATIAAAGGIASALILGSGA